MQNFFFRIDRRRGRKSLQDYLRKNHEIFKLQVNLSLKYQLIFCLLIIKYILNVKNNEIERLENDLRQQERLLIKSEKNIIEDIALFDQFLDAWNRTANEATLRYISK